MDNIENSNPWKTLTSDIVFDNPWIKVTKHDVINPSGKPGNYSVVHFKNIAIGIIPLDEDMNTWIVGQYRYPLKQYSWEIPEGGGKHGVPVMDSAKRELLEETGIKAEKWTKILDMHLSNSVSDEYATVFIAQVLSFTKPEPEETEQLHVMKIPFELAYSMVMQGKITDSMSVAGILKTKILMQTGMLRKLNSY
jgi:ADP-ribose pyrophosphatase